MHVNYLFYNLSGTIQQICVYVCFNETNYVIYFTSDVVEG